jgi:copper chaperone CopZ
MSKLPKSYLLIGLITLSLVATAWFMRPAGINLTTSALAEYQIEKLTCGSCVSNIQTALAPLDGIGTVDVNLTRNIGRVTFDPAKTDSQVIAETIASAGYPAKVRLELSAEEYSALRNKEDQLGQKYVARVGSRLISRSDFDLLVRQQAGISPTPPSQQGKALQKVWQELLQRELLLAAAEENNIIIQNDEIDLRLNELQQGHQGFEQVIKERYGDMEQFRELLREDMIISRNLDENVYAGVNDPQQRQSQFQGWYASLEKSTDIAIFDPRLKDLKSGGSGCSCCG